MILPELALLFAFTVPLDISDDLHTPELFVRAEAVLLLLSMIAPEVPLPTADELVEDYLSCL